MSNLFTPLVAGAMSLKHRIVLAPLTRIRADANLCPTDLHVEYYSQRATDGGLLISEATYICPETIASRHIPGIWTPEQVSAWKKVTDAVHAKGGKISCQLWHVGRVAHSSYSEHPFAKDGGHVVCESAGEVLLEEPDFDFNGQMTMRTPPKMMTLEDIDRLKKQYIHAAKCAMDAGFDSVELHGAHGYLIDQFMNDGSNNKRTDQYGGSIENRIRLLVEVLQLLIDTIGNDRVAVRLSPHTNTNSFFGNTDSNPDALYSAAIKAISPFKLSYLLLTEPRWDYMYSGDASKDPMLYSPCVNYNKFHKDYTGGVVIGAGGFSPISASNAASRQEGYDAIAMGRWFISNPDLVFRLQHNLPLNAYNRSTFYLSAGWDEADKTVGYTDYPTFAQVIEQTIGGSVDDVIGNPDKIRQVVEMSKKLPYPLHTFEDIGVSSSVSERKEA